jgi:hypothetical protein
VTSESSDSSRPSIMDAGISGDVTLICVLAFMCSAVLFRWVALGLEMVIPWSRAVHVVCSCNTIMVISPKKHNHGYRFILVFIF